jgi:TrmH family RNA methyltransferase
MRVTTRNARFQQWQALLANRTKRQRAGEFMVQGVRPITLARQHGWEFRELLYDADRPRLSEWATGLLDSVDADRYGLAGQLLAELGEKGETPPELLAVVAIPPDVLGRIPRRPSLAVAIDRPANPGNVGSIVRSADAFGADGVLVTGHAADPYDPRAVRASTGSLFAVPVVRLAGHPEAVRWAAVQGLAIVGADEHGPAELDAFDFSLPTMLVIGTEGTGLSTGWRQACHQLVRIPMVGAASSLNAATAAAIALYECGRQRRLHVQRPHVQNASE